MAGEGASLPDDVKAQRRLDRDVWTMMAVLWIAHFGILASRSAALGMQSTSTAVLVRLLVALLGFASTALVYLLLRRRRLNSWRRFGWAVLLSLPLCALVSALNELLWLVMTPFYQEHYHFGLGSLDSRAMKILVDEGLSTASVFVWVYVSWCALFVVAVFAAELRDRDNRLAVAEGAAHQAQLMALRFQLNPHFLFNTLNTLSGLIALDRKKQAEEVVLNLSDFLRYSLAGEPDLMVTLARELEAQRMYLDIERVRFADRLKVRFEIGPGCEDAYVPAFLLQPLVENVVKHAVAPSEKPVTLTVAAERQDGDLVIRIENSASTDPPGGAVPGFGIGMANVRKRLQALFGSKASLEAQPTARRGWVNLVTLPWLERPVDARPDR